MTSTTATSIVNPMTRDIPTYFSTSQLPPSSPPTTSWTVWLIESQTPAAESTDQMMKTDTTVTTPKAIASRNDVFITDHGSIRVSRKRARRGGFWFGEAFFAAVCERGSALARCSSVAWPTADEIRSPRPRVLGLEPGGVLPVLGRPAAVRVVVLSVDRSVIRPHSPRQSRARLRRWRQTPSRSLFPRLLHPRLHRTILRR